MSIKTSADEWVRKGPTQAIAVVAAVGVIVGGLIGLGVGFKVEQSRTKDEVNKLQRQLANKKAASPGVLVGALGQRVGTVTAKSGSTITITTKQRGAQTLATTATTLFESTTRGTIADVHSGRRILVTVGGSDIIVLSADSKLGRVVTNVASDVIKIGEGNGLPPGTIKTADVHGVENVKSVKLADVAVGDQVFAGGRAKDKQTFSAIEVIVLADGSGFAT